MGDERKVSEKDYKHKAEQMFQKNTILINELEQAKKIITKFLLWENDWHEKSESKYELLKQAEEFLKENENV